MNPKSSPIFIGDTAQHQPAREIHGEFVPMLGDTFYKIKSYDALPPFFMSLASSSNHWLFISSTGGLSAGRVTAEQALFPYYTDDKLTENSENTGSKTNLLVMRAGRLSLWEPLSDRHKGSYQVERNLYKNVLGTAIVFEEHNISLGLTYRYAWRTSDTFGFIKTSWLVNLVEAACQVELLDGIQNILPDQVTSQTQNTFSPLLDAYKRSELDPQTGLAIFALNSTLTDLPEPSESLLATTVMQLGLDPIGYLLASTQLDDFRFGRKIRPEAEVRGRRGAYFVHATLELASGQEHSWHVVADVSQDGAAIVSLSNKLRNNPAKISEAIAGDIALNDANLKKIVASADGLQVSSDALCSAHHFANVMFNVMRGGTFAEGYRIRAQDFAESVALRNRSVLSENALFFSNLPAELSILDLYAAAEAGECADLIRLSYAYLPLSFSRRHGDPSRPWNRFAIDIKKPDGSLKQGYEGNWRDIFQNWEALAWAYPEYVEGMICTFLNATTLDGYNPYRITHSGIDWELPEPHNPWTNIGYWSDHQIIYLQKLMEISAKAHPGRLESFLARPMFSYADVPYRLKPYTDLQENPFNTIDLDWDSQHEIEQRVQRTGSDGRLVHAPQGRVIHVTLAEKLLTLLLAKLVNFVPEGGLWMNTQRPEWNDANNALVGKGLSVVTLCYLRRTLVFCQELLSRCSLPSVPVSVEIRSLYSRVFRILDQFRPQLSDTFSDEQRRLMVDALGQAGSDYRWQCYRQGLSVESIPLAISDLVAFLELTRQYIEHTLRRNKRADNLYHAYNILHLDSGKASISRLYEMLEGQVAILSAGLLSGEESLSLLESLRQSKLYRADQHSYMLYPDRDLPAFLEKNCITPERAEGLRLVAKLVEDRDASLLIRDGDGNYHFSSQVHNAKDVRRILESLQNKYPEFVKSDRKGINALFEEIFHHNEFTGRSGTFFAYEGLGSIYWHMVSKLLLAVQETILRTRSETSTHALVERYLDIRKGLSFNKSPEQYGAFPTDPYSHTPKGQGAKQPGMTGLVKEEILTRQGELGYSIQQGQIVFDFPLLDKDEFLAAPTVFDYWNVDGIPEQIEVPADALAYTVCQVPVLLRISDRECAQIFFSDGSTQSIAGYSMDAIHSRRIFQRDGSIHHLVVEIPSRNLQALPRSR